MGLFAKIMVSGFHFLQQKPWQLFLAKKLEKYELRVRDESPWVKAWMHGEPSIRGSHSSAFHAANLKKYFSFEDEERDRSQGGEELNQATGQAFAEKGRWSVPIGGSSATLPSLPGLRSQERSPGVQHTLTLLPPALEPRFQLQSRIYHRSGQEALSCRCGTLYLGLCCKAPIGEPHGLPCPPEDSSLSSCFSQLLTEFLHQATVALSFLTR